MSEPQLPLGSPGEFKDRTAPPAAPISAAEGDSGSSGLNLKLLYAILAIALATAIGLALFVVLPFYRRQ